MKPKQRALAKTKKARSRGAGTTRAPAKPAKRPKFITDVGRSLFVLADALITALPVIAAEHARMVKLAGTFKPGQGVRIEPPEDAWGPFAEGVLGEVLTVDPAGRFVRVTVIEQFNEYRIGQILNVSPFWLVKLKGKS